MIDPIDRRVVDLCAMDYNGAATPTWETPGLIRAFLHREPSGLWVICEGTRPGKIADWLRDFDAWKKRSDPSFGDLHAGFYEDALSVIFRLYHDLKGETVNFGGHSKGGSEAEDLAALWVYAGEKLGRVTALEPARTGKLGGLLADKPGISTHVQWSDASGDPVTAEPLWLDHPRAMTVLKAPRFALDPIDYHELATVGEAMDAAA